MDPPAVIVCVRITASEEDVRRQLVALIEPVAAQPGCLRCALLHDATRPEVVTVIEEWRTRPDMERHFRSQEFWRLLLAAELSSEPPEFSIDTLVSREGLEAVARSRANGASGQ
jgi:quinol monooxygenase YgiN